MSYSINELTTVADCDALLQIAAMDRKDLDYKRIQQERQYETVTTGTAGIEAELAGVDAEIHGTENALTDMPEGPIKKTYQSKLVKLNHKKFLLNERRERYGTLALLQKEFALATIDKQLVEITDYVDAITTRKGEL